MKNVPITEVLFKKVIEKEVTSFRAPVTVIEDVASAATILNVNICDLWTVAMQKLLEELKPQLAKAAQEKKDEHSKKRIRKNRQRPTKTSA